MPAADSIDAETPAAAAPPGIGGLLPAILDNAAIAFSWSNEQGEVEYVNRRFVALFGYQVSDIPTVADWMTLAYPDAAYRAAIAAEWQADLDNEIDKGIAFPTRERIVACKDGSIRTVILSTARLGQRLLLCFSDITERKLAEQRVRDTSVLLQSIMDNAPYLIWLKDIEGRFQLANAAFLAFVGRRQMSDLLGKTDADLWPPDLAARYQAGDAEVLAAGQQKMHVEPALLQGQPIWVEVFRVPVLGADGRPIGVTGFARDITDRTQAEQARRLAAMVYQASSDAMAITDPTGETLLSVNAAFTTITGFAEADVVGRPIEMFKRGQHEPDFYLAMWQCVEQTGQWSGELWTRRKNGESFPAALRIDSIYEGDGRAWRRIARFTDISEQKKAQDLIWHQANFDQLTDLPNRRMFRDRLEQAMRQASAGGQRLALLFIDLDHFKEVNDTLGHNAGDSLLQEVARRLRVCVGDDAIIGRSGGDEFTVIMRAPTDVCAVDPAATAMLQALAAPYHLDQGLAYVSASIGITLYPDDAAEIESLLMNADQAMYAAKARGRSRVSYFKPAMQKAASLRVQLANDLRGALAQRQFRVVYQPIIDLSNGLICKAEALLRWDHPERGAISPADFIPIAEETGLIIEIGDWVFRQAATMAAECQRLRGVPLQISVNKSPVQFREGQGRPGLWRGHLAELGLSGDSIAIEITEGLLLDAGGGIQDALSGFRGHGIQVSIDDFGTGYSSLSYLKKFNIDSLKIDQSFVQGLAPESNDMALCEAIIVMAHRLGIRVIAEGIETAQQQALLTDAGCDFGQGYLISRPISADDFASLIGAERGLLR